MNALFIDDQELRLKSFPRSHSNFFDKIDIATNFEDAIAKIQNNQYSIVFMDVMIGEYSCLDIAKEIKKKEKKPKIIIIHGLYAAPCNVLKKEIEELGLISEHLRFHELHTQDWFRFEEVE